MEDITGSMAPKTRIPQTEHSGGGGSLEDTTLDEPVIETIKRDAKMVWHKMKKVAIPSADTKDELRNWWVTHHIPFTLSADPLWSVSVPSHMP